MVGLAIGVIGHEEVRRLLLISVQDKWEHSLAWHAPSIEEAVAFTEEVRTRRATSLSTIYQGSWNKKRVPLLIVNFPQFTEEVGA